jgi:hypothetical protein
MAADGTAELMAKTQPTQWIRSLTTGPDGNVWGIEDFGYLIRITPEGEVVELTAGQEPAYEYDRDIVVGADGDLWFTSNSSAIAEVPPVVTDTTQPDTDLVSKPKKRVVSKRRVVRLAYEMEATPGATVRCAFGIGKPSHFDLKPCEPGELVFKEEIERKARLYSLIVTSEINGVADSSPSIHKLTLQRKAMKRK